jgi:hypothetical protein
MNRIVFIGIIVVIALVSCVSSKDFITSIELVNMNVLYAGEENQIKVMVEGVDVDKIEVSINNGTILGSHGKYIVVPRKVGRAILTVSYNGRIIQNAVYRVKQGIGLACYLETDSNTYYMSYRGHFSKSELLNNSKIIIDSPDSDFDTNYEVIQFTLSLKVSDSLVDLTSHSNRFTEEQKALILEAKNDTRACIWNTIITRGNNYNRKLSGFYFDIKDN